MSHVSNTKPVICVDFDGTLCHSSYPDCGPPIPGAKEALEQFRALGYWIHIYSCRSCHWRPDIFHNPAGSVLERPTVVAMRDWLIEQQIPFDEIDDGSKGKPLAQFYCDDRAVRVNNNWPEVAAFIASHAPRQG